MGVLMKRILLSAFIIIIMLSFSGCSDNKNLDGLIDHFKENDISGRLDAKAFAFIGAINGAGMVGQNINLEIYEWKDSKDIRMTPYKNGRFGMIIHSPRASTKLHKKLIDTFEDY